MNYIVISSNSLYFIFIYICNMGQFIKSFSLSSEIGFINDITSRQFGTSEHNEDEY